jgi:hypothetical protein
MIKREFETRQTLIVINDLVDSEGITNIVYHCAITFPSVDFHHNSKSVDFSTELYS